MAAFPRGAALEDPAAASTLTSSSSAPGAAATQLVNVRGEAWNAISHAIRQTAGALRELGYIGD